jgi:hypothetical protein
MYSPFEYEQAYGSDRRVSTSTDWHLNTSDLCEETNDWRIGRVGTGRVKLIYQITIKLDINVHDRFGIQGLPIVAAFII